MQDCLCIKLQKKFSTIPPHLALVCAGPSARSQTSDPDNHRPCSGAQSRCGMSAPTFSNRVSSIANRFDSQVLPAGASECQSSLGRLRVLFLQCLMLRKFVVVLVCGVCARMRAWQRVRARPPAHRLPSDRLAIHQRTCSPALPDLRAAPLTDLGQCRRRPNAARMPGPGRAAGKRAPASLEGAPILPRLSPMPFLGS
jgi:hypothetical protein